LAVFHTRQDVPLRRAAVFELVHNDNAGHVGQALEQPPEELLGVVLVPPTLYEKIQDMAVLIHGTPQIVAFAVDGEKDFIQVPRVAGPGPPMPELIGVLLSKLAAPFTDGLVRHDHAACKQQLFDITVTETESIIEPHAVADNFGGKAIILVATDRGCAHTPSMAHCVGLNKLTTPLTLRGYPVMAAKSDHTTLVHTLCRAPNLTGPLANLNVPIFCGLI
jgi:hypothetical protein